MPNKSRAKDLASPGLRIVKSKSREGLRTVSSDEEEETVLAVSLEEMMKLAVSEIVNKRATCIGELVFASSTRMLLVKT